MTSTPPTQGSSPDGKRKTVQFTARFELDDADTIDRVTDKMRRVGRLNGGRYPSRADVFRAVMALVDADDDLAERVAERVKADLTTKADR